MSIRAEIHSALPMVSRTMRSLTARMLTWRRKRSCGTGEASATANMCSATALRLARRASSPLGPNAAAALWTRCTSVLMEHTGQPMS